MRLKLIACEVLARQAYYVAALGKHVVDIELIAKGLHDEPDSLRTFLQDRIDAVPEGQYDAILLGYGLCSNSTATLIARHTQIVLPRAHDCITLFLGSAERYSTEFSETPGTFWYMADYIERGNASGGRLAALGAAVEEGEMRTLYEDYVTRYGRDNADYLMEVMGAWQKHYSRAAYIENPDMPLPDYRDDVRQLADRRSWRFEQLEGSLSLVHDLLAGEWTDDRFLVIPPGYGVTPVHDSRIISATPSALE
ncbi:MAG: DUF1638 domain-containing protein [Chloroflexi bacterium]|nr:DUF1638 domain-containing protein [Chloroflexota bacterium]